MRINFCAEDLIIEALYGSLLSSDTRKGVEDKYLIARDNLSNLMNDGSISYSYGEDNKVHLQINDYEKVIKSTENLKNMD